MRECNTDDKQIMLHLAYMMQQDLKAGEMSTHETMKIMGRYLERVGVCQQSVWTWGRRVT